MGHGFSAPINRAPPPLLHFVLSLPWPSGSPRSLLTRAGGAGRLHPLHPHYCVGPDAASCTSGHGGADMDGARAKRLPPREWPKEDGVATGTGNEAALGAEVEA